MSQESPHPPLRRYPPAVTLVRRSRRHPDAALEPQSFAEVEDWLLHHAGAERDLLAFVEGFAWRLVAAGAPLDRLSLHVGTLHPQLIGFAWNWMRADGICDEVKVADGALEADSYRRNPLWQVFNEGVAVRCNPQTDEAKARFPMMADLAAVGLTDYIAFALAGGTSRNALTLGTTKPGGFDAQDFDNCTKLVRLFALHVDRHTALRISDNALGAYLGNDAARRVLAGSIRRGAGESIRAVIWVSDLRGFTALSDRLNASDLLAVLNSYFEIMAEAVIEAGGEVLKFIGDGLLAVFPPRADGNLAPSAAAALQAALQAQDALAALNADPPAELADIPGWRPLSAGIALHAGDVFFGNIGSQSRLDFTVIGTAVNEASRVEALHKQFARPVLITGAVAELLDIPLDTLGSFALRGVAGEITVHAPREKAAAGA